MNDVVSVSDVDQASDVDLESTAGWVNDVVSVSDVDQVSTSDWVNELDEMTVDDLIVMKIVTSSHPSRNHRSRKLVSLHACASNKPIAISTIVPPTNYYIL